ncbi:(2Fe-2S)-binding domain-containing protein [Thermaerobacter marianensis DSM 12885]|uniref:(2Fe-2S)-binding domain-containing protein n=1 Tax=Thermaerobacter marianensis (strain ATCC 700841 / DSM 12885 / JCM 10246 / 7p75a) TaxID=644966 RepID=E6SGE0_THEM7|nr:(2Fe-2S)-binding domain-containing protein [Thermaerobacter marianensis DSM 12885]
MTGAHHGSPGSGTGAPSGIGPLGGGEFEPCREITVWVNGTPYRRRVPVRMLLADFLRHELGLTGTHVGCEHGVCGACTVLWDGDPVRSCLLLAVQADGARLTTVEGLAPAEGPLHPIQEAFREAHALQCGFCTPGFLLTVAAFLRDQPGPDLDDAAIREALSGNLCRCTGYQHIVEAVKRAARRLAETGAPAVPAVPKVPGPADPAPGGTEPVLAGTGGPVPPDGQARAAGTAGMADAAGGSGWSGNPNPGAPAGEPARTTAPPASHRPVTGEGP